MIIANRTLSFMPTDSQSKSTVQITLSKPKKSEADFECRVELDGPFGRSQILYGEDSLAALGAAMFVVVNYLRLLEGHGTLYFADDSQYSVDIDFGFFMPPDAALSRSLSK
jgi:hypothetical protein